MMCHSPSLLDDKKVSSEDTNHFGIALAEKTVDRADSSLCFENYDIFVMDLSGTYPFKFSLKADKTKR